MKLLAIIAVLSAGGVAANEGNFLNVAILTVDPKYLSDIPLDLRSDLLKSLSLDPGDRRLDYANGWFDYHSDRNDHINRAATSTLQMKLLPRKRLRPLVFVHMPKPLTNGRIEPQENQTFVLEYRSGKWIDVTSEVMPEGIDLTAYFFPLRDRCVIEIGAYQQVERRDGLGKAYHVPRRESVLIWEDGRFVPGRADSKEFTRDNPK